MFAERSGLIRSRRWSAGNPQAPVLRAGLSHAKSAPKRCLITPRAEVLFLGARHCELPVGNETEQEILEPLRSRVIALWRGLMVLLRSHVVQCVFDKERPAVARGPFFLCPGEKKINASTVLVRGWKQIASSEWFSLYGHQTRGEKCCKHLSSVPQI